MLVQLVNKKVAIRVGLAPSLFEGAYQGSRKSSGLTTRAARSMMCGGLYACDALLQRLAKYLKDVPPELGQFIQEEHAMVRRIGTCPPPISPTAEMV
jgi:hypothetical protein